jgi:hypothetical protein
MPQRQLVTQHVSRSWLELIVVNYPRLIIAVAARRKVPAMYFLPQEGNCIPRKTAPGSTDTSPSPLFDNERVEPHLASAIQEK